MAAKYPEIKKYILEQIDNGKFKEDVMLPSEKEFTELFNVSRMTVRRAFDDLIQDGAQMALKAHSIPLVVIKVHDCMSILLGSKERFERLTENNKSIGWSCYALKKANYTNDSLLKWQSYYDEETIAYLKEMLSIDVSYYISLNIPLDDEYLDSEKQVLTGDLKFLEKIINLKSNEIVDVYPGQRIVLSIDDSVIKIV